MARGIVTVLLALGLFHVAQGDYKDPHCAGNRHGIVHLFEWKWNDIAKECEDFLGPYGYCAVQTSPANENRIVTKPNRPWWERYQPVSYKLDSTRSGNEQEFKDMVKKCNDNGVRVYVDVVINHMTGSGGQGKGTGGSSFDASTRHFPGVPFGPTDFNSDESCPSDSGDIEDYSDPNQVRNCNLVSLLDLKMSKDYVRTKVSDYMNHLIELGVAGFRVDAAKHMWPGDLTILFGKLKDVQQGGRPFIVQEVIDQGGEPIKGEEYTDIGRITNFKFGAELAKVFRKQNELKWLKNFGTAWGMWPGGDVVNFLDNHDNQRGHGGAGAVLTHWESKPYKLATAFMLAFPYGVNRIMSSYEYDRSHDWEGPPHNSDMSTKDVIVNGMICGNGWSCEHRWRQIYNMVAFNNIATGTGVDNWWSGADYQIAFSRGNKAFIAFNLEDWDLDKYLQTGMPAGTYCDVIDGNLEQGQCTGNTVTVGADGKAHINICGHCNNPMVAIHAGARMGGNSRRH